MQRQKRTRSGLRLARGVAASASLLAALGFGAAARADFVGDLAQCAGGPIEVAAAGLDPSQLEKAAAAAEFAIEHGQCIPRVVAVDPLLVSVSVAVAGMQSTSPSILPGDADACIDASIGVASKPVAGALDAALSSVPGGGTILSSDARELLRQIAKGEANKTLFQIPGFALVAETLTCGCAVASTGLPVEELKSQAKAVLESVEGCEKVLGALLGGAYEAGAQAAKAVADAAKAVYGSLADGAAAAGCAVGIGSCDDDSPPFLCVGYDNMRAGGASADAIKQAFAPLVAFNGDAFLKAMDACETGFKKRMADQAIAAAEAAEEKRLKIEIEKAAQLGSANALGFAFHWSPKCRKDAKCEASVAALTENFNAEIKDPDTIAGVDGAGSFSAAVDALWAKYSAQAKVAVALGEDRVKKKLRKDRKAPTADRLWAFGCNPFLGRDRQSLCAKSDGFDVCKSAAKADRWDFCAQAGKPSTYYAKGVLLEDNLRAVGCIAENRSRTGASWQCLTAAARDRCSAFRRGGSAMGCAHEKAAFQKTLGEALKVLTPPPPPRTPTPETAPVQTPERPTRE